MKKIQSHAFTVSCVLTFTKLLGASVSMRRWLQESSAIRSEMNLKGVAFTSCRLTPTNKNRSTMIL